LKLNGVAGRCQWEWWRSLRSPAGCAMPCIKLLPLLPPRGRHWPVGGFQQCGVCVLSSCCSLSVDRLFFMLRAGLLVSFPEGMVSCKPGQELGLLPHNFCRAMWLLQCGFGCMGRRVQSWRRAVPAMDVNDVWCVHVSVRQACSGCVSGSAAHALEGRNREVCSSLCPWCFCDASGAEVGILPGRCCAASLCSISCWY